MLLFSVLVLLLLLLLVVVAVLFIFILIISNIIHFSVTRSHLLFESATNLTSVI